MATTIEASEWINSRNVGGMQVLVLTLCATAAAIDAFDAQTIIFKSVRNGIRDVERGSTVNPPSVEKRDTNALRYRYPDKTTPVRSNAYARGA
jgi:hypothetical protein